MIDFWRALWHVFQCRVAVLHWRPLYTPLALPMYGAVMVLWFALRLWFGWSRWLDAGLPLGVLALYGSAYARTALMVKASRAAGGVVPIGLRIMVWVPAFVLAYAAIVLAMP